MGKPALMPQRTLPTHGAWLEAPIYQITIRPMLEPVAKTVTQITITLKGQHQVGRQRATCPKYIVRVPYPQHAKLGVVLEPSPFGAPPVKFNALAI